METSKIAEALCKAQSEMKNPIHNKKGGGAQKPYAYADLAAVLDAVKPPLNNNGISLIQTTGLVADTYCLITTLLHKSGDKIESHYPLKTFDRPQDDGTALTYARRYAICSIAGVFGEEDSDGHVDTTPNKPKLAYSEKVKKPDVNVPPGKNVHALAKFKAGTGVWVGKTFEQINLEDGNDFYKWSRARYQDLADGKALPEWAIQYLDYLDGIGVEL